MFLGAIPVALLLVAVVYQLGMTHLEHRPRSLGSAIGWAAETLTTTGYGHDNEWQHPLMQVFVIVVQFMGLFIVFLIIPVFLLPFFEERFEGKLPGTLPVMAGKILVYGWGPEVVTLVEDLEASRVPLVLFEEDEATARRLHDRGKSVVFASTEDDDPDLRNLRGALGVVANGSDSQNAALTMTARQQGFEGPIVALIANPKRRAAMSRAGASAVFTPKHALAAAIAAKASARISPRVSGAPMLGEKFAVSEVRIHGESSLCGKTLRESGIGSRTGAQIIGRWIAGDLVQPTPDMVLDRGAILVAVGTQEAMDALTELSIPIPALGPFVICGFGETGRKVCEFLIDAGERVVVVHNAAAPGVTHEGDPLDPDTLKKAGIDTAQAVILTLEDDSETAFAIAVARGIAPDAIVIAAADHAHSVSRIRRAGADFCFSVGQVAAQLMRYQLLGEQSMSLQPEIKIVRAKAGTLAGSMVLAGDIRQRTGCSIVAVERSDGADVRLDSFALANGDAVYISGTQAAIERYFELFEAR